MKHSTPFWAGLALFVALGTSAVAGPLKVGVTPGALADSAEIAAKEARAQGLDVKVVEFTEWTTPNTALASGDLDLNYFQHQAFLDNANKQAGFKLGSIRVGLQGGFGIFSRKFKTLAELPHGARVAIANDPSNQARALSALQEAGLIKLKPDAPQLASLRDVGDNPKGLKFIEIQGPQLARSLDDVDAVLTAPGNFVTAGQPDVAKSALFYTRRESPYWAIQFVTRADNATDPRIAKFISIYQGSEAVRRQIHTSNASDTRFYSLAWLKSQTAAGVSK